MCGTTCSRLQWRCMPPELDSRFLPVAAVHVQAVAAARCGSGYAAVPWALPELQTTQVTQTILSKNHTRTVTV
jgi:hypothetical protein